MLGNLIRGPLDFDLVGDHVHHGAHLLDAHGNANRHDCQSGADRFVGGDALQIGMNDASRDRVGLHLADQSRLRLLPVVGQRDDGVASGTVQQFLERVGVHGDMIGNGPVPEDDRRHLPARAQRLRTGRSEFGAMFD